MSSIPGSMSWAPARKKSAHNVFGGQIHEDPLPTDTELLFVSAPREESFEMMQI
jgi:hypothetical protein